VYVTDDNVQLIPCANAKYMYALTNWLQCKQHMLAFSDYKHLTSVRIYVSNLQLLQCYILWWIDGIIITCM